MQVRISPADKKKIESVYDSVRRHVEIEEMFSLL
jgi:hypothetical protein